MMYDVQDYLFDVRGYLIVKQAVEPDLLSDLNHTLDALPALAPGAWHGNVQRSDGHGDQGTELQNIVEAGEPFERLIDHAGWIDRVRRYAGEDDSYFEGLFIDECFASIRGPGGYFPVHSGAHEHMIRTQYHFRNGHFMCGQVNVLLALTDVGPGDGATMVIPGSHKASFAHPQAHDEWGTRMDALEGAVEVHLDRGDALLFVDALAHGASSRVNPGERRVVIFRYGPRWGATRHGYHYSDALLKRLTPERRLILQPIPPRRPPQR